MLRIALFTALAASAQAFYTPTSSGGFAAPPHSSSFHNRPLYGPGNGGLVLAGDRPIVHLADDTLLFGGFMLGVTYATNSTMMGLWAHDADGVAAVYQPGSMSWNIEDSTMPGMSIVAAAYAVSDGLGAVIDANVTLASGVSPTTLVWAFGCGAEPSASNPLGWLYDPQIHPDVLAWDFTPDQCAGNRVAIVSNTSAQLSFTTPTPQGTQTVTVDLEVGPGSGTAALGVANASFWSDIVKLVNASNSTGNPPAPLAVGQVALPAATTIRLTWSLVASSASQNDPLATLAAAQARVARLTATSAVTPDPLINAAVAAMGPAVDGLWRNNPGAFVHGAMAWDVLYVGWRSEYGATVLGWSDKVAQEGTLFFNAQNRDSTPTQCESDPTKLLTQEAPTSRFYGRGHIGLAQGMYDMQSQMFDQQVRCGVVSDSNIGCPTQCAYMFEDLLCQMVS
jgi:hypothetical protein